MKYSKPTRCAVLAATILFGACSGTSNVDGTPATHPPLGDVPPQQVVIANASDETISPLVHAASCWVIDPPFPAVAGGADSDPVKLASHCGNSEMSVDYEGSGGYCTLDVRYYHTGPASGGGYTYVAEQGFATKCTVSSTANGAVLTYAVKS